MTAHLSAEQLVDIAEGARPESSGPHLQACGACRKQLDDLRAMMTAAADVDVPEPSPLFWDHFSARVHQAVEAERESPAPVLAWSWLRRPLVWAPGMAAALLAVAMVSRVGPDPEFTPPAAFTVVSVDTNAEPYVIVDDPSLSLVADLAADLDWDAVVEAGLTTHVGMDDDAVLQLTDGERRELRRLLRMELTARGQHGRQSARSSAEINL